MTEILKGIDLTVYMLISSYGWHVVVLFLIYGIWLIAYV